MFDIKLLDVHKFYKFIINIITIIWIYFTVFIPNLNTLSFYWMKIRCNQRTMQISHTFHFTSESAKSRKRKVHVHCISVWYSDQYIICLYYIIINIMTLFTCCLCASHCSGWRSEIRFLILKGSEAWIYYIYIYIK